MTAGRVEAMFGNMPEFTGQIRHGGLRAAAYGATEASPLLPDLPAVSPTGLPGFVVPNRFGVVGPGGMPRELAERWNAQINRALQAPDARGPREAGQGGPRAQHPRQLTRRTPPLAPSLDRPRRLTAHLAGGYPPRSALGRTGEAA